LALKTILTIEVNKLNDDQSKKIFKDMVHRVMSMFDLHEILVEDNLEKRVELNLYLQQISEKIHESMGYILNNAHIEFKGDSIEVSQEQALRCGLIINELLINIYKHAFEGGSEEDERIDITLVSHEDRVNLRVSDNGTGLPEDFEFGKNDSVGMWLIQELLNKLGGEVSIESNEGARFTITFPLK
jgi:two-component sensor histidine kinase